MMKKILLIIAGVLVLCVVVLIMRYLQAQAANGTTEAVELNALVLTYDDVPSDFYAVDEYMRVTKTSVVQWYKSKSDPRMGFFVSIHLYNNQEEAKESVRQFTLQFSNYPPINLDHPRIGFIGDLCWESHRPGIGCLLFILDNFLVYVDGYKSEPGPPGECDIAKGLEMLPVVEDVVRKLEAKINSYIKAKKQELEK